jgi:hypothetical protein
MKRAATVSVGSVGLVAWGVWFAPVVPMLACRPACGAPLAQAVQEAKSLVVDAGIVSVTLFRERAMVTREAALPAEMGTFELVVKGLPPAVDGDSLAARVEGGRLLDIRYEEARVPNDPTTNAELKAAIVEKLQTENKLTFTPEQILVSVGGKQALYNCFQALLSPGDEVVIFSPYWVSYPDMVRLADGEPKFVETSAETNWTPEPNELRKVLSPRTRAVIFNSPSNPTGAVISRKALEELADVLRGAGLREVSGVVGAHLVTVTTPGDLVGACSEALDLGDDDRLQLTHALVRRRGTTGPIDALLHRTRLLGRR